MPALPRPGLLMADAVLRRAGRIADDAAALLTGRAALLGLTSRGQVSAGGATRLLRARDGWCALTLSRPDDIEAVPALLQVAEVDPDPWPAILGWAAARGTAAIAERARLLDLPIAVLDEMAPRRPRVHTVGGRVGAREPGGLLVADLTSMWAGPLCGQLLARAGATVVKVESPNRPDGTRAGHRGFFDWMNGGKLSYRVDFDRDRSALAALLAAADIVLEASRPAALTRRGLGPDATPARPGRIWLRITGYGTAPGLADRVAFGDDAAVAGGLVGRGDDGDPVFLGDAIADPITGLESFGAVRESLVRGGGELIEIAMSEVAAEYAAEAGPGAVVAPTPPTIPVAASELGADNAAVVRVVAERSSAPC